MTAKLLFRLEELGALHANVRRLFVLILLLTAFILSYMGVKVFLLADRMKALDLMALCCFATACFVLCNAQLYCLRRMRGTTRVKLEHLTFVDELTGVYNYRYVKQRLGEELQRSRSLRAPLSVVYLDVDNFKVINDVLGHDAGNRALRRIAQTIRACVRGEDFVGRLGGDEFLIVLPQTDPAGARIATERVRARLNELALAAGNGHGAEPITFSMGVASYPADGDAEQELLHAADEAMYRAKRSHAVHAQAHMPAEPGSCPPEPAAHRLFR